MKTMVLAMALATLAPTTQALADGYYGPPGGGWHDPEWRDGYRPPHGEWHRDEWHRNEWRGDYRGAPPPRYYAPPPRYYAPPPPRYYAPPGIWFGY